MSRHRKHQPGPVDGTELTFRGYDESQPTYGFFDCSCGGEKRTQLRYVFSGYPSPRQTHDRTSDCGDRTKHKDKRLVGDNVTFGTVHKRIVKARGSAKTHPCAACGEVSPGNQWSYRHSDPSPLVQGHGKDRGMIYSTNLDHYWVLCRRHHGQWDSRIGRRTDVLSGAHVALAMALDPYDDEVSIP